MSQVTPERKQALVSDLLLQRRGLLTHRLNGLERQRAEARRDLAVIEELITELPGIWPAKDSGDKP